MADVKISALPASTTPLDGTEVLPIVQGTTTKQVSIANVTAGRSIGATSFVPSGSTIPTNGVYLPAANAVGLATNTVERIRVTTEGNVGVGTSTPTNFISFGFGSTIEASGGVGGSFISSNAAGTVKTLLGNSAGATSGSVKTLTNHPLILGSNDTERLRIFAAGGVSIGNTTDPGAKNLSVSGTISPQQATTAAAPAYVKGAIYFDTTLNKLRVGGATAWETITSV